MCLCGKGGEKGQDDERVRKREKCKERAGLCTSPTVPCFTIASSPAVRGPVPRGDVSWLERRGQGRDQFQYEHVRARSACSSPGW